MDALRGIAAALVVLGHARALALLDWPAINSILWAPLYAVTGLGHEAVVVFFALSGFWVGGRVLTQIRDSSFDARQYWIARSTRIIPTAWCGLVLAVAAGGLSIALGRAEGLDSVARGPAIPSLLTFAGNVAFLQPSAVPAPWGNGALWSLGYEVQIYVIVGLAAAISGIARGRAALGALLCLGIAAASVFHPALAIYLAVWLGGALVALARRSSRAPVWRRSSATVWATLLLVVAVAASATQVGLTALALDIALVAVSFVLLLHISAPGGTAGRMVTALAWLGARSYSIYATHLPVMLLASILLERSQAQPGLVTIGWLALLAGSSVVISLIFFHAIEKRTPLLREKLSSPR